MYAFTQALSLNVCLIDQNLLFLKSNRAKREKIVGEIVNIKKTKL